MSAVAWRRVAMAAILVATACSGDERDARPVDSLESTDGMQRSRAIVNPAPPADEAALAPMLAGIGLDVDRAVELPGAAGVAYVVVVDGATAIDAWADLRTLVGETGRYPVIVGGPRDFGGGVTSEFQLTQEAWEFADAGYAAADEIGAARDVDVATWLDDRGAYLGVTAEELGVDGSLPRYDAPQDTYLTAVDVLSGEPFEWIEIALLPTSFGWEAPAYLAWGGWNDVPPPHELVAIFQRWFDGYGAEVVAMTGDVVEFAVTTPPNDDEDAVELAREHFLVAPDLVWQGTGDLAVLAAAVQGAPVWFFWWD